MKIITNLILIIAIVYYTYMAFMSLYIFIKDYKCKMIDSQSILCISMSIICIIIDILVAIILLR